ncbi:terminase large subunit domain-containing protein [Nocardioides ochotonae]|uniref:terminase large subunit domain-containing protein n=1 Tax=Nocardioides ochotonae TaxID=2685869 RepID=UPI00140C44B3|nr:terminase large subunit [Nocardioides ochotonae]
MSEAAYALATTLRVVAGSAEPVPWGSVADARQRADMHALLAEDDPRQHVWQRARGYMKTTDSGVAALASLLVDVPPSGVVQVFAVDQDQARKIMTAIRVAADHLPADAPPLKITANGATRVDTEAAVVVETSDAASALGASPHLLILDEFANWKDTGSFQDLWDHVYSGLPKQGGARILIVTSAGPVGTWAHGRLTTFQKSRHWRYSLAPGPAPWRTPEDLERQREGLSSHAAYRMFHLNEFTSAEDALVTEEDLAAAVRDGVRERPYDPAHGYVITADLGTSHDASVITVCHREGNRVVQDTVRRWLPRLGRPVPLPEVRDELVRLHEDYGHAPIRIDPSQARLMVQEAQAAGVLIEAVTISVAYNHNCTTALQSAFEQRRIDLLDVKDQTDELLTVVVRTKTSGGKVTVQMDSSGNGHDDQADALGMAVEFLMSRPHFGMPHVTNVGALSQVRVRHASGATPVRGAAREGVRVSQRDLSSSSQAARAARAPVRDALAAYARARGWAAPGRAASGSRKQARPDTRPSDAAPPAG